MSLPRWPFEAALLCSHVACEADCSAGPLLSLGLLSAAVASGPRLLLPVPCGRVTVLGHSRSTCHVLLCTVGLTACSPQVDQRVFRDLMSEKLPRLHAHLEQHSVDYTLITFNWFLVLFVDSVVSDILFKIWDSFLYEGPKVGVPAGRCGQRQWWQGGRLTWDTRGSPGPEWPGTLCPCGGAGATGHVLVHQKH